MASLYRSKRGLCRLKKPALGFPLESIAVVPITVGDTAIVGDMGEDMVMVEDTVEDMVIMEDRITTADPTTLQLDHTGTTTDGRVERVSVQWGQRRPFSWYYPYSYRYYYPQRNERSCNWIYQNGRYVYKCN